MTEQDPFSPNPTVSEIRDSNEQPVGTYDGDLEEDSGELTPVGGYPIPEDEAPPLSDRLKQDAPPLESALPEGQTKRGSLTE